MANIPPEAASPPHVALVPPILQPGYRWRLLAVLWLLVAIVVALPSVGTGVVNTHMAHALGLDRGIIGAGFGLFVLMMGLPAPLVAAGVRRFGIKPVILAGCALLLAGTFLMGTVVMQGWHFVLAFGLLVGGGVATAGVLPAQAAVARWFVDRRALAVAIVLSAIDVGGIVAAPALEHVVASAGGNWRAGWHLMFALACVATLVALLVIRHEGPYAESIDAGGLPLPERASGRVFKTTEPWGVREAVRDRAFQCVLLYVCVAGIDWIFFLAHGVAHLRDVGFDAAAAATAVAVMVSASLAGNMIAGVLGDRIPPHRIAVVTMLLMTAGLAGAIRPQGEAGLWLYAVPLGLGYGASQVCLMAMLGNYYGAKVFPQLFGVVLAAGTLTAAVCAGAAGAVFDQLGHYRPMFHAALALTVLAAIAIAMAAPPRRARPS